MYRVFQTFIREFGHDIMVAAVDAYAALFCSVLRCSVLIREVIIHFILFVVAAVMLE